MSLNVRLYQIEGVEFLKSRRFALLADEMRVGKTPQAILAAAYFDPRRVIVVCPAIAVLQWRAEFMRWWPPGQLAPDVIEVMSYDRARITDFKDSPRWDVAIVDECHYVKNPTAKRTKAIYGKDGLGWHADRMWCLSGTPVTKHAGELWPMLRSFGAADTYEKFVSKYCTVGWDGRISGTKESQVPELQRILSKFLLRRTRKQVAPDMPDVSFDLLSVKPWSNVDLNAPPNMSDPELERWMATHTADASRAEVAKMKVQPLAQEIIAAFEHEDLKQTVVFAWHREAMANLRDTLESAGLRAEVLAGGMSDLTRRDIVVDFAVGKVQVVIAQIVAAGTAIDLSAASHGYFLELDWLPANNAQAANRLVSLQKKEPVTFDVCTVPGSIDDAVQRVLLRRVREIRALM